MIRCSRSIIQCRHLPLLGVCTFFLQASAQSWQLEQQVAVGVYNSTSHVSLATLDDLLVIGISSATGGHVQIRNRHQGGLDQWGLLGAFDSSDPWFGFSLALREGTLAVGAPGLAAYSGTVHLYRVNASDVFEPLLDLGEVVPPELLAGDRFGYSVAWLGDTLAVSAVGRTGFRTNGAVFLFGAGTGYPLLGELPIEPDRGQVPFQRWFGASIARMGDRLAVAAPFSGFQQDQPKQDIGTIHLYQRNGEDPTGWALDTILFDAQPQSNPCVFFQRVELGRGGMAFMGDQLVVDHSTNYTGPTGSALEPWRSHGAGATGCEECALRVLSQSGGQWDVEGADTTGQDVILRRGVSGWCAQADRLFVNWYDTTTQTWSTAIHRRNANGANAWGVESTISEADTCDVLTGPIALSSTALVRTSSTPCDAAPGFFRLLFQVYRE